MNTAMPTETSTHDARTAQPLTLVLAATGKTGRRVADRLEARGLPVRRASRSAQVPFDWDDATTWEPALAGVERVYVVYTPDLAVPAAPAAIQAFTDLAVRLGVRRLVLLSGRGEEEAQRCERIVLDTAAAGGVDATVVRASWFAQNFSEGPFAELVLSGTVALPAGDVREPFVDIDDVADVAVAALTEDGHAGEVYEVTGPELLTFGDAIARIASASGRPVEYVQIPIDAFTAGLADAGLPPAMIGLLEYLFTAVLDGHNAYVTDGVQRALGRAPRSFDQYASDAVADGVWALATQEA
ncbi:NAD(P)H azoreductase [Planctomycetes bacterium Pla163]|uniref:NAD(P)H azoreductase n=1 Tax=Rohdeia mirabilis TaxID=2528008 RepID=A0A518CVC4_9BACT|nr:NAD(P)H azoreductase [Planctomycetes bacterium Pla163]